MERNSWSPAMKLLIVTVPYPPYIGGTAEHSYQLAVGLSRLGHDVTVSTIVPPSSVPRRLSSLPWPGLINVLRFRALTPLLPGFSPGHASNFKSTKDDYGAVINIGYDSMLALQTAVIGHPRMMFISLFHGLSGSSRQRHAIHKLLKPFNRIMFRNAKIIVCGSKYEASLVQISFPDATAKIRIVRPGITRLIPPRTSRRETKRILDISMLHQFKGVQDILRALPLLPEHVLDVVGEGPYMKVLQSISQSLGIADRVAFHGVVTEAEKMALLRDASVFVHLSRMESYSLVVGEALAAGLPCVVLKSNALAEWVDGMACFGIEAPIHPPVLADTILRAENSITLKRLPTWGEYAKNIEQLLVEISGLQKG